jgi:hypothetical protein
MEDDHLTDIFKFEWILAWLMMAGSWCAKLTGIRPLFTSPRGGRLRWVDKRAFGRSKSDLFVGNYLIHLSTRCLEPGVVERFLNLRKPL